MNTAAGKLVTPEVAETLIQSGKFYYCAADEKLLKLLPAGNWLGGTIPYFMAENGGETTRDKIYIQEIPTSSNAAAPTIIDYGPSALSHMLLDAPENGFSIILLPASSQVHADFAENAPSYDNMYMKPLIGWVTGIHLDDMGSATPKVVNGKTKKFYDNSALVIHCPLPDDESAIIDIVNLFEPDDSINITFTESGFSVKDCIINGETHNLSEYIKEHNIDTRLPLVSNYCGAIVNVAIQEVDEAEKTVKLYAPVFKDTEYHLAKEIDDYVSEFSNAMPDHVEHVSFSCNCILNYLYSELEGKKTGNITGPMTFGEIAYQLMNQTLVYMHIEKY